MDLKINDCFAVYVLEITFSQVTTSTLKIIYLLQGFVNRSNRVLVCYLINSLWLGWLHHVATWINIGSFNASSPIGTKPLSEPMFTNPVWGPVSLSIIRGHFRMKYLSHQLLKSFENCLFHFSWWRMNPSVHWIIIAAHNGSRLVGTRPSHEPLLTYW